MKINEKHFIGCRIETQVSWKTRAMMITSQKHFWIGLALCLLIGVITACQRSTVVRTLEPTLVGEDWVRYVDPDQEFSFAYPSTANMTAGENEKFSFKSISIQFDIPEKGYQGMSITQKQNPDRLPANAIAAQIYEEASQKPPPANFAESLTPVLIAGRLAVQANIPPTNTETMIIVPDGEKLYIFAPVHDAVSNNVEPEALDLFYQILNSFDFNINANNYGGK